MNRLFLAMLSLLAVIGLASCDLLGPGTDPGTGGTTDIFLGTGTGGGTSGWWIKGSFDGWVGVDDKAVIGSNTVHLLSVDAVNPNLLSFEMTKATLGLRQDDYKFVLMGPDPAGVAADRIKFNFVFDATTTKFADNTVYTLVPSTTTGTSDIVFTASATSYTILVDTTDPAAPRVKLIPGSSASTAYTELEIADGLNLKGSVFDGSWTAHTTASEAVTGTKDAVYDATAHTVTWDNLKITKAGGAFGIDSLNGWLVVPDTVASSSAAVVNVMTGTGSNPTLTGTPTDFSDTVYTFVVTIDYTKTVALGRYSLSIAVKTLGTTAWPAIDPLTVTIDMTNGAGNGDSWGAQLGQISTAVSGSNLLVKITFAKRDAGGGNNVWLLTTRI